MTATRVYDMNRRRASKRPAVFMTLPEPQTAPRGVSILCLDLDGTLADSIPAMRLAYDGFLARFGKTGSDAEFQELNGPSLREIAALLQQRYGLPPDADALLRDYTAEIASAYERAVQPMHGAEHTLRALHDSGLRLALVTANVRSIVTGFIKGQAWDRFFDFLVCGEDATRCKPAPDLYLAALDRARVAADCAAAVEDSPHGVSAAAAAGLLPIGFAPDPAAATVLERAGARRIIRDLRELPPLAASLQEAAK